MNVNDEPKKKGGEILEKHPEHIYNGGKSLGVK